MIKSPQFLEFQGRMWLMVVSRAQGEIVDISGPFQCVGGVGESPLEMIQSLAKTCHAALHGAPVLALTDLPDEVRLRVEESAGLSQ